MEDVSNVCGAAALEFISDERYWRTGGTRIPQPVFARWSGKAPAPPATMLLRARRGGAERRLRLLLWLSVLSRGGAVQPVETPKPFKIGPLLGVGRRQDRQVYEAFRSLVEVGVVERPSRGRYEMRLPDGRLWPNWNADDWAAHHEERQRYREAGWLGGDPDRHPELWVTHDVEIPNRLLSQGHLLQMSGAAIVVLLTLLDAEQLDGERDGGWFRIHRHRSARYGYSYDTQVKGVTELVEDGVVERSRTPTRSVPDVRYRIHREVIGQPSSTRRSTRRASWSKRVPFDPSARPSTSDLEAPIPPRCRDCGRIRRPEDGEWYVIERGVRTRDTRASANQTVWWCEQCVEAQ